jgi:hypothetical protein
MKFIAIGYIQIIKLPPGVSLQKVGKSGGVYTGFKLRRSASPNHHKSFFFSPKPNGRFHFLGASLYYFWRN